MKNKRPANHLSCGCCSDGCRCVNHIDIPRGCPISTCAYHADLPVVRPAFPTLFEHATLRHDPVLGPIRVPNPHQPSPSPHG